MEAFDSSDQALIERFDRFGAPLLRSIASKYARSLGREYALGLLGPAERKTVEPIVRQMRGGEAPARERDTREMLNDSWSHRAMMWQATESLLDQTDGWQAWTVDDTAILKQGEHSVGVANQYAGCVGTLARCQVLVTLGIAQDFISSPCAAQLFFPAKWEADAERRRRSHVPNDVRHEEKWRIALSMLDQIELRDLPRLPVLADSAYGDATEFRAGVRARGLHYVVAVSSSITLLRAGVSFVAATAKRGEVGRPPTRLRAETPFDVVDAPTFARALPADAWRDIVWRHGSKGEIRGRFAAARVRPARGIKDDMRVRADQLQPEQWLLMHWPEGDSAPTKYWLASLPEETSIETLISYARMRWRVERDYREAKGLLGLDHFEGRCWFGLHHHAAFVIVAQAFFALERWRAIRRAAEHAALVINTPMLTQSAPASPPCAPAARRAQHLPIRTSLPQGRRPRGDGYLPRV